MKKKLPVYIGSAEAQKVASKYHIQVSRPTIIKWCKQWQIVKQFGNGWLHIDREKLVENLRGKNKDKRKKEFNS